MPTRLYGQRIFSPFLITKKVPSDTIGIKRDERTILLPAVPPLLKESAKAFPFGFIMMVTESPERLIHAHSEVVFGCFKLECSQQMHSSLKLFTAYSSLQRVGL